jgi:uncharacterized membrane protein YjfL (UPF0719 family)
MFFDYTKTLSGLGLVALCSVSLLLAKWMHDYFTPYRIGDGIGKANTAMSVSFLGYILGVMAIMISAIKGPSRGFVDDVASVGGYSILGMVLLNISWWINEKAILGKFSNVKEIVEDQNTGTGAVQFGSYMASGLIVAGAIHGEGGGIHTALAFFTLGQAALIFFTALFDWITPYDLHKEIEKDNVAAGVAAGGALTAVGIILMKGAGGDFISWPHNVAKFLLTALICLIMLPVVRYVFSRLIIPGADLSMMALKDRNLAAGLLEAALSIGLAALIYFAVDVI